MGCKNDEATTPGDGDNVVTELLLVVRVWLAVAAPSDVWRVNVAPQPPPSCTGEADVLLADFIWEQFTGFTACLRDGFPCLAIKQTAAPIGR